MLDRLTKPPGSLGRLEDLARQVAGITGDPAPDLERRAIVVFAADHGVAARGVSAYPSDVTAQMVANFLAGGAAINALAPLVGTEVIVVDVGVAGHIPTRETALPGAVRFIPAAIRRGSRDLTIEPALTVDEAMAAMRVGADLAIDLAGEGCAIVGTGEMGIGNTTCASAIVAALSARPVREVTGRGTGVDDATLERKVRLIERALATHGPKATDPVAVLACFGGLEIAALTGFILGAAASSTPIVLDGFVTGAAALVAARLHPGLEARLIASHRSAEPGHRIVLDELALPPLLDLGLRLGEGSGAALGLQLIAAACRIRDRMATFDSADIAGPLG